ncbi:Cysteinyl-tRNA Synthetase [Ectocarpus siliculosus]|uniref:cysteine--tRNA ligase n=1 Tax=Ectocarpus siliculosus TaxID=2880 RepID=D7G854_ECTSI|nr:Cysteinyl-tRNA Synthetase [Ectocarpus siliculosus]|eukprot:CBJ27917.1 Cysteinyl-tRNA Synthetase [Ectocarpus siliculosus]
MGTLRRSSAYDASDRPTATSTCGSSRNSSSASATTPTAARAPVQPAVWNTVNGCLEPLPDPSTGMLKWYSCGPTVYDSAHLGHARTYVSLDVIRRVLTDYFRFDVTYALGITDVDDKIIARARENGLREWPEVAEMAAEFERQFLEDMSDLGVRPPDALTRVTDHIPDIVAYIQRILENGMGYEAAGGVYFDVEGMGGAYGKLGVKASSSTTPEEEGGSELRGKRSHKDFALWKTAKADEPSWESPFGRGRPGWHIECSAMTHSLFGPNLDVHSGGVDLKFPHHTNEIAQCEAHACGGVAATAAATGDGGVGGERKPWVRHWIHTGHLNIEGLKMSKSLKNFVTIREYLEGHSAGQEAAAEDFRMFCLMHKYSSNVTFSEDRMEEASVVRGRLQRFLALADVTIGAARKNRPADTAVRWGKKEKWLVEETSTCRREVRLALSDDFDTPRAVRHLASLCALISPHLKELTQGDLGPVVSARNFAAETLALLGVGESSTGAAAAGGGLGEMKGGGGERGGLVGNDGLPPAREVVDAMVEFRRMARKHVLERNLKKNPVSGKLMKRDLLQLIDHTRDETLPSLGVHVHDEPDNQCTWMVLPPDQRKSRRRSEDQAEARAQAGGGNGGVKGATLPGDAMWADGDEEEPPLPGGIPVPPAAVGDDRRGG